MVHRLKHSTGTSLLLRFEEFFEFVEGFLVDLGVVGNLGFQLRQPSTDFGVLGVAEVGSLKRYRNYERVVIAA